MKEYNFIKYVVVIGPKQVLEAKKIIGMITGESKRELAQKLLSYTSFDQNFPLSIIYHPGVQAKTHLLLSREVML